ncbi:MAG: nitrous oxide reductase accessory protein NosL [bacterium]|nr:nitrous oxide reductase accessory protein NosL [bacterium]
MSVLRMVIVALVFALLLCTAALAKDERPRCELCNMFWDISATRITAEFKGVGSHKFESLGCMYQSVDSKAQVTRFKVLDYASAKSESQRMIDGKSAHYLYGTSHLKGSMAPFVAAFSSKDSALAAQDKLGGEYMKFDGVWKKLASALKKN